MSFIRGSVLAVKARFLEGLLFDPTVVMVVMNFSSKVLAVKAISELSVELKDSFYFFSSVKYFLSVPRSARASLRHLFYPNTLLFLSQATLVSDYCGVLLSVNRMLKVLSSFSIIPVGVKFLSNVFCSFSFFSRLIFFVSSISSIRKFSFQVAFLAQFFISFFSLFRCYIVFQSRVAFCGVRWALRSVAALGIG